jgi:hypothetical protein
MKLEKFLDIMEIHFLFIKMRENFRHYGNSFLLDMIYQGTMYASSGESGMDDGSQYLNETGDGAEDDNIGIEEDIPITEV